MRFQHTLILFVVLIVTDSAFGQQTASPCSLEQMMLRQQEISPDAWLEYAANEAFIKDFIRNNSFGEEALPTPPASYIIPVVLHIFHDGEDGRMEMVQVQSGLDILNQDFNGLNEGWNTVDSTFETIKGALDIEFCLATIDPDGNPTTGVYYYDDAAAMTNSTDLFVYAWDNYKYLNIYIPKYVFGGPSDFTAYAYLPSTSGSDNDRGGIFYSSIRWGYGAHSELEEGQDWASVITHEAGHWLDLQHTFLNGCAGDGDGVADTPPTTGGAIELSGCDNNDFSCGVPTNGENFMDYNHDCKKMFTQGQVERMTAALHLPSRNTLWSEENLMATGCAPVVSTSIPALQSVVVFPNPTSSVLNLRFEQRPAIVQMLNVWGQVVYENTDCDLELVLGVDTFPTGTYVLSFRFANSLQFKRIIIQ